MRPKFGAVPFVMSLLILGSAAHAATVRVTEGELFVSRGNGYERVAGTAQVRVGDSVMAGEFGVGQISYANGCAVTVRPGAVVAIGAQASCAAADDWSTNVVDPASEGLSTGQILLGVAIAGGVGAGVYALTQGGGDDKPASP
jgi:hypothetical protein